MDDGVHRVGQKPGATVLDCLFFKTRGQIPVIFGIVQPRFVMNASVNCILNKF